jgi:membrane protein
MNLDRLKNLIHIEFLISIYEDTIRADVIKHAYAMAYVTLFSLIPSLAASFALVSLFTPMFGKNSELISEIKAFILKNIATGSGTQAIQYLETFLANTDFKKIGITGLASTMVALILLLKEIEVALNRIFEISRPRPLFVRFVYFWTFLTMGTFILAVAIGTFSSQNLLTNYVNLLKIGKFLGDFFYFGSIFFFFLALYKFVPNCFIPLKKASVGALFGTVFLSLAIKFFSLYVSHFTSFQAIYGALSALPIFLFWLYIIWFITLFGALLVKRSIVGWNKKNDAVKIFEANLNEAYFKCVLPFLSLLTIYEASETSSGNGASLKLITERLNISLASAASAAAQLEDNNLILSIETNSSSEDSILSYFPRIPASKLTYSELKIRLLGNENEWLNSLSSNTNHIHLRSLINAYLAGDDRFLSADLNGFFEKTT